MSFETEDRLMTAAMIMLLVGAAMAFLGLGLMAIGIAIAEFRSVGKADTGSAVGVSSVERDRNMVARLDGAHRADCWANRSEATLGRFAGNPRVNDREGDVTDVRLSSAWCR